MHDMDRALGFLLHRGVDDTPSDAINEEDANKGALMVRVCALRHHGQQVGVQALVEHTAVPHHTALGMNVLTAAFPLHLDDPLYFRGNGQLPTQLSGEILSKPIST